MNSFSRNDAKVWRFRSYTLARRTVVIVVAGSRIVLAAAEPIEKAARLRPGPLPVGLILLVPVPEKLGLDCHVGRLG
jgi:hypothetical protein